ncbi:hypothetical protein [Shewanella fidelis]|uniref:Transmembrane protein n=1 Tax=Shewanella fidelis TaxID=173509 RepID=A0AAW8NPW4_9GAMM|nr:hypothetical protein [Shewanella fidelis]MDR8524757.1 hypothetical protein [Shewanella fidelis]MDW4810828.1 hypothetical protein [Shewanella fidelis]MDW4815393.1 hypothetical protein [Shewanella fidelis]MDW4819483.1 hypothetical protein [Shewanella fidelis]MDW4822839.1 hypothetical protein [Shewanella fidelis]
MASTLHSQPLALEDKSLAHLLYGLMACFPLFLIPVALSLFINLYQPPNHSSRFIVQHLRWQRWSIIGFFLVLSAGYLVNIPWLSTTLYLAASLWFIGRIFKGWLSLIEGSNI